MLRVDERPNLFVSTEVMNFNPDRGACLRFDYPRVTNACAQIAMEAGLRPSQLRELSVFVELGGSAPEVPACTEDRTDTTVFSYDESAIGVTHTQDGKVVVVVGERDILRQAHQHGIDPEIYASAALAGAISLAAPYITGGTVRDRVWARIANLRRSGTVEQATETAAGGWALGAGLSGLPFLLPVGIRAGMNVDRPPSPEVVARRAGAANRMWTNIEAGWVARALRVAQEYMHRATDDPALRFVRYQEPETRQLPGLSAIPQI